MEEYRGLKVGCAPGTHEGAVEMICRHVETRTGVLDLGAHSGALLARLRDHNFTNLCAADLDSQAMQLDGIDTKRVDLNEEFGIISTENST